MTYREAMRDAIRDALATDERGFVMGEDVADYGGTYAVTKGLHEEFGRDRVRNTPLSESGFVGAGIGAALGGLRPIVEIMTVNFSLLALDQLVNTAATLLHMSGGQFNVPLVVRMTTGAGSATGGPALPQPRGLVRPRARPEGGRAGTPEDARWMLPTALADPNPVIIFEHSALYNERGPVDPDARPGRSRTSSDPPGRRRPDDRRVGRHGPQGDRRRRTARRSRRVGRGDRPAIAAAARPRHPRSVGRPHPPRARRRRGWRTGGLNAEIAARSPSAASGRSTHRSRGWPAPRCRSRTPSISRPRRSRRSTTSSPAHARSSATDE
jgi:pyruvate dehydrogenase E1 component beta subunit